ncbi:transmembrane protein [Histomonas meleagridis]|uniref:uncharacterized protein n=1 Tax=Histomonas meleagridis TaxID=135588 RepID=UPI00355A323D|nr:transmembrane protein [Histomonas meleagridis]KAH0801402.1 transmembrane protein [Histomonas meleagridis]
MDLQKTANIKANSRLRPAKDLHTIYSEMLANKDPEQLQKLKAKMLCMIDSAEIEYKILTDEVNKMDNIFGKWEKELENYDNQFQILEEELAYLNQEKDEIASPRTQAKRGDLIEMKIKLEDKKNFEYEAKTAKTIADNAKIMQEIQDIDAANVQRKEGFDMIIQGFQKFMLVDSPSEENLTE